MPLLDLPPELLLLIGEYLSVKDISRFLRANRYLSCLLTPRFHKLALEDIGSLTALQWAACHGYASLAELVLSKGAGVKEFKRGRWGPLHIAAAENYPDVIRVLAKRRRWINIRDGLRSTPLHAAASRWSLQAIRVLLELGADMTCADHRGQTPVHISASQGDVDSMRAFIDASWDFSIADPLGWTVLHDAILGGKGMVEFLLENGGKGFINVQDILGKTLLHCTVSGPLVCEEMTRLLCRYGADMEVKDYSGKTPMDLAIEGGRESWLERS